MSIRDSVPRGSVWEDYLFVLIWYIEGLFPSELSPSKKSGEMSDIMMSEEFCPGKMWRVISLLICFQFLIGYHFKWHKDN